MIHTYQVTGITCSSCESKIKSALLVVNHVTSVVVSKDNNTVTIGMDQHISLPELQKALDPKYQLISAHHNETLEQTKSWFATYKPVLLIFFYLLGITLLIQAFHAQFDTTQWMRHFMAGFFLVFSFFKFLNLHAFAQSYAMYDIVAKRFKGWGYIYAFAELLLGLAYLANVYPFITNWATAIIMSVSIVGVLQTVLDKKKIQCACLGAVFNLPMSTVTIIEDGLMIAMSLLMIVWM